MIIVRRATMADSERILEIYDYYVRNTAITFEYETPSLDEFKERMRNTMKKYPYLVIEKDDRIEGYAYAGKFVGRAAYDWSCEMTIYLDHNSQKCGMGRRIYETLENELKKWGFSIYMLALATLKRMTNTLQRTVPTSMHIWDLKKWESFINADINLNAGII